MLRVAFSYSYAECHYSEGRYAKYHFAEYRGAVMLSIVYCKSHISPLCSALLCCVLWLSIVFLEREGQ